MSELTIKGRVIANLGVQSGTSARTGKAWSKATLVVESAGQYPKKIAMDNMRNAEGFAALAPGTDATFHIEVESREYNGRWYTSVNCWKWEAVQGVAAPVAAAPQQGLNYGYAQPQTPEPQSVPEPDDLPF